VLSFGSPAAREAAFLLVAIARSALISCFVFVAWVFPLYYLQWLRGPLVFIAEVLSLPIRGLGLLIPPLASPLFQTVEGGDIWELFWHHMIVGVAAYVLLFHVPFFSRLLRRRWGKDAGAPA